MIEGIRRLSLRRAAMAFVRPGSTLLLAGVVAAAVVLAGTRDHESYEHAFFSLSRGTRVDAVRAFGQPVYTQALGLGVRLPLHGSLGASPVAAIADSAPAPVIHWLLIGFAVAAAAFVARHALEPLCGRLVSWAALLVVFVSVPLVGYTVSNDWPETAITYGAVVASVFAPHALLSLWDSASSIGARRMARASLGAVVFALIAASHPGYWPVIAVALVLSASVGLLRGDHPLGRRLASAVLLGGISCAAVLPQIPDLAREVRIARELGPELRRIADGPGGELVSANLWPAATVADRAPFMLLPLVLLSLVIGLRTRDARLRRPIIGAAAAAIALGLAAGAFEPGRSLYAPSTTWSLRDPAVPFTALSAACAAAAVWRLPVATAGHWLLTAALALGAAQGIGLAASLAVATMRAPGNAAPWNRDMRAPAGRLMDRGFTPAAAPAGQRVALWPDVRQQMRQLGWPSTDFADAGYTLVTAWTKQRTMRRLVAESNGILFNQTTDLSRAVLCDPDAVRFLRLEYLVVTPGETCEGWTRVPDLVVDGELEVAVPAELDTAVRGIPLSTLSDRVVREPALSPGSHVLSAMRPLPQTSLHIASGRIDVQLGEHHETRAFALTLPVAYDPGWQPTAGRTENIAGLLALMDVDRAEVSLAYHPSGSLLVRAATMRASQIAGLAGLIGLALAPLPRRHRAEAPVAVAGASGTVTRS